MHFQSTLALHSGVAWSTGARSARATSTSGDRPMGSDGLANSGVLAGSSARRWTSTICGQGDGTNQASKSGRWSPGSATRERAVTPAGSTVTDTSEWSARSVHAASSSDAQSNRTPPPPLPSPSMTLFRMRIATTTNSTAAIAAPSRRTRGEVTGGLVGDVGGSDGDELVVGHRRQIDHSARLASHRLLERVADEPGVPEARPARLARQPCPQPLARRRIELVVTRLRHRITDVHHLVVGVVGELERLRETRPYAGVGVEELRHG